MSIFKAKIPRLTAAIILIATSVVAIEKLSASSDASANDSVKTTAATVNVTGADLPDDYIPEGYPMPYPRPIPAKVKPEAIPAVSAVLPQMTPRFGAGEGTTAPNTAMAASPAAVTSTKPALAVTTGEATGVTMTAATLNGNLVSNGGAREIELSFEYGYGGQYTSLVKVGKRPYTGAFNIDIAYLNPSTTYQFRARAEAEGAGISFGERAEFTTTGATPVVTTNPATEITARKATLNGRLAAMGETSYLKLSFEIGMTAAYGTTTARFAATSPGSYEYMVNGLLPNTTYHYRLKADGGGSLVVYGENQTFTTPAA